MGKPRPKPRSHGFHERFQSSRVIHSEPRTASMLSCTPLKRDAVCSVSPIAKRPTASVVMDTPSSSDGTPKASRDWPVSLSMPTRPSTSPSTRLVMPRSTEVPNVADTVTKASTISAK